MAFDENSTTDDVLDGVDLDGMRVLVTGVSAGLGVETVRSLTEHGATVVGTARDLNKAEGALAAALSDPDASSIDLVELDLASLASVRSAAEQLLTHDPFDVIIANAGVMACPHGVTTDGFETQFGTNHLGHFVFINRVAPLLADGSRVVVLSSNAHRRSDVDLDDPGFENSPYDPWRAYGRSKTANALFAAELNRRLSGRGVTACSLHPGGIRTELARHLTKEMLVEIREWHANEAPMNIKSIPQGAATSVWCAVVASTDEIAGRYCQDCQVAEVDDTDNMSGGVRSYALDADNAAALWRTSELLVNEEFTFDA